MSPGKSSVASFQGSPLSMGADGGLISVQYQLNPSASESNAPGSESHKKIVDMTQVVAQGTNAEDPAEAVAAMESELETQLNIFQGDQNIDPSLAEAETEFQDDSEMPETLGGMSSSSTQHKNKRKKDNKGLSSETAEVIADSIQDIKSTFELHSTHISNLVTCFKVEQEGVDKRMKLMAMLRGVDGLSTDERMKATIIISRDSSLTDVFFSLTPEDILAFVKTVVNNYA